MIRQPSSAAQIYAWHRAALNGEAPEVHDGIPEAGWYKTRLVKGGPFVPVKIWVEREIDWDTGELASPERLVCDCDGQRRDPARLWTYLTPISRDEYAALVARRENLPAMRATMVAMDLTETPVRFR